RLEPQVPDAVRGLRFPRGLAGSRRQRCRDRAQDRLDNRRPRTAPGTTQGTRRTAQGAIRADVAAGVRGDRSAYRAAAGPALGLSTSSPLMAPAPCAGAPTSIAAFQRLYSGCLSLAAAFSAQLC